MIIHFCFHHFLNGAAQEIFKCVLNIFSRLDVILFKELMDNISFSFCHLYSMYRFLLSCHVIPLTWATSQDVNLTLNSDVAEAKGKAYQFQAKLYAGAKDGQALIAAGETDTGVTAESLSLTVAENTNPSLKITDTTGTHRLLTTKDSTLDLDVQWKNIDRSYTVSANIQKKTSQGYEGVLLQAAVSQGKNKFSLGGITGSGSYRLVITVTKDQRTVMEVPYYFIVQ